MTTTVPIESIVSKIVFIRDEKVMLDRDLAELYGVETGALNRAVKRNTERFPEDFMFQVTGEEAEVLRCQTGISKPGRGGRRYLPFMMPPAKPRKKIGFVVKEKKAAYGKRTKGSRRKK